MSKKKREEERAWKARKENQQPHGKVKAFAELVEGTEKRDEYFITFCMSGKVNKKVVPIPFSLIISIFHS